jgi:hypothetical protein
MIPGEIDAECLSLVQAMNSVPGVETVESCCGHGRRPFRIWFCISNLEHLSVICSYVSPWHTKFKGWKVEVRAGDFLSPVVFCLEGPVGAYKEAEEIAACILTYTDNYIQEGSNMLSYEEIMDQAEELGLLYPTGHENAIVGIIDMFGRGPAFAVDTDIICKNLQKKAGMSEMEAREYIDTIGVDQMSNHRGPVLTVDRDIVIKNLIKDGMSYEEAEEWLETNMLGSWMGETTPVYITRCEPKGVYGGDDGTERTAVEEAASATAGETAEAEGTCREAQGEDCKEKGKCSGSCCCKGEGKGSNCCV